MSTGGGFRRRTDPRPRPAWVQLALQLGGGNINVDDYREMMQDIQERNGHPYRDIRFRNLYRRDRQLYRQLRSEQANRDVLTNRGLSRHLPPELVRLVQEYRHADENREIERVTNHRNRLR